MRSGAVKSSAKKRTPKWRLTCKTFDELRGTAHFDTIRSAKG